ncbi:GerAB/ArcD/ProY family transporter [Heliorestis acidaminivorans]|uniref:GerAB/ArcD/ProY family transporter n=1 Tax=Heliorestis acidaminivorans TaxID=553427 RepID=A0A6I0F1E0_9FIRM|nr:GerAB/ArcD/ProY family transporter [Heliorestis acidaminivorans]KAB2953265.1 GerAB/ArcD/ProY family transporter [Heliorestis acidaminivorans]
MYSEKISMLQIGLLMASFFVAGAGLYYNGFLFQTVDYNPFVPLFSGLLLSFIPAGLAAWLCARYPRKNILTMANELVGPFFGFLIVFPLVVAHFTLPLAISRIASELIVDVYLEQTPPWAMTVVLLSISCWIATLGTEAVARTNDEHLVIIFPLTMIMFLLSFSDIRPELTRPYLQVDFSYWIQPEFYGSLLLFLSFTIVLFLNNSISHSTKIYRMIFGLKFIGAIYLFITAYMILGTLGMEMAATFDQPLKVKMTTLRETVFIERIDIFLVLLWLFPTVTSKAVLIVTGARALGQWMSLPDYRRLVIIYYLVIITLSPLMLPFQHAKRTLLYLGPIWMLYLTLILLILAVASLWKNPQKASPRR